MKKIFGLMLLCATMVCFLSCQKEEENGGDQQQNTKAHKNEGAGGGAEISEQSGCDQKECHTEHEDREGIHDQIDQEDRGGRGAGDAVLHHEEGAGRLTARCGGGEGGEVDIRRGVAPALSHRSAVADRMAESADRQALKENIGEHGEDRGCDPNRIQLFYESPKRRERKAFIL